MRALPTMSSPSPSPQESPASIFLPFTAPLSANHVPQIRTTIHNRTIAMPLDTGSTGLLIGAPLLPSIPADAGTPTHHFFTSSRILYAGRLVPVSVRFHGHAGAHADARVPVLVVDRSWTCPWYRPGVDAGTCPEGPGGEKAVERDVGGITYMGVGFGRNGDRDGMPVAGPGVNPFLNLVAVNGRAVGDGAVHAGFVIGREGVRVGLTAQAVRGFSWRALRRGITWEEDRRDWAMVEGRLKVAGGEDMCGDVLVDTGIPQMYVRAREGVVIPSVTVRNPNPESKKRWVRRVRPGTEIAICVDEGEARVLDYKLVVGDGGPMEPKYVFPVKQGRPPFVNTGRNFLFGYDVAFDAVGGRFGFRSVRPGANSSSLL